MKQTSHYGKVTDKDAQGIKVENNPIFRLP